MSLEFILAGVILVSLTAYVLLGGADYGAGVWNLLARGPRAPAQRELIAGAIGPIWEANHVWLILVITVTFTAFPTIFSFLSIRLHIPLTLLLIGIVLRGSAFAFRSNDVVGRGSRDPADHMWDRVFAWSSVWTPIMLGITIGTIASGRLSVTQGSFYSTFVFPWTGLFPILVGIWTLVLFAYLAAVYLIVEAKHRDLREDFRGKAMVSGIANGLLGLCILGLVPSHAPALSEGFADPRSVILLVFGMVLGAAALVCLWTGRDRWARVAVAAYASMVLLGWACTEYSSLVVPELTIYNAAAPASTLSLLLWSLLLGALLLLPSLGYLYGLFKGTT